MPTPISMTRPREINLYPSILMNEGLIHIQIEDGPFPDREYLICNQTGSIIRKGMVGSNTSSFSLRMAGFQKGEYEFIMCNQHIKFVIH